MKARHLAANQFQDGAALLDCFVAFAPRNDEASAIRVLTAPAKPP